MEVIGAASQDRMDRWFARTGILGPIAELFSRPPQIKKTPQKRGFLSSVRSSLILDDFFCIDVGSADDLYHIHPLGQVADLKLHFGLTDFLLSNETSAHL